jgi:hypothetical protein
MRVSGSRRRLLQRSTLPLGAALLLAGCASMPSSGEVRKVDNGQHTNANADTQVRVFAIPPRTNEAPADIVSGFLEATTSDETDFATAKKYLSKDAASTWNPSAGITVYSANSFQVTEDGRPGDKKATMVSLSAAKAAVVDGKHGYHPDRGAFQASFHLVKQDNEWRIDGLQDGLVLNETDFQQLYHSANMYYFANLGADSQRGGGKQTLVADPVYLRNPADPLADPLLSAVSALLGGPTDWLKPVVSSAALPGTRLYDKAPDDGVTLDDSQHLRVRLDHGADRMAQQSCVLLAAQLFATVQAQGSAKLSAAEVLRADGSTLCTLSSVQAAAYGPENLAGVSSQPYYIASDAQKGAGHPAVNHRLMQLIGGSTAGTPVPGSFGASNADLGSVAIRQDEAVAAGVRTNGRDLVVGSLVTNKPLGQPVLTSHAANPKTDGLSAPSWDGFGDLWVADRNPDAPRLLMLRDGTGTPIDVTVPGLDGRVESLRIASDGVRIALVVRQGQFATLELGRIERGTQQHPDAFSVTGLRNVTPAGENVTSVSWAGASRLVVLGNGSGGGVQQIQYMNTDGSAAPALEGINEATSVAASEDQTKPLLASYNGGVYLLPADANWEQVSPPGVSPVYPG